MIMALVGVAMMLGTSEMSGSIQSSPDGGLDFKVSNGSDFVFRQGDNRISLGDMSATTEKSRRGVEEAKCDRQAIADAIIKGFNSLDTSVLSLENFDGVVGYTLNCGNATHMCHVNVPGEEQPNKVSVYVASTKIFQDTDGMYSCVWSFTNGDDLTVKETNLRFEKQSESTFKGVCDFPMFDQAEIFASSFDGLLSTSMQGYKFPEFGSAVGKTIRFENALPYIKGLEHVETGATFEAGSTITLQPDSSNPTFILRFGDANQDASQLSVVVTPVGQLATSTSFSSTTVVDHPDQRKITFTTSVDVVGSSTIMVMVTDTYSKSVSATFNIFVEPGVSVDDWQLIMKIRGSDGAKAVTNQCDKYQYSWDGWANGDEDGDLNDFTLNPANRKFAEFGTQSFRSIMLCSGEPTVPADKPPLFGGTECYIHTFDAAWSSAAELFQSCTTTTDKCEASTDDAIEEMLRVFDVTGQKEGCVPLFAGFNQKSGGSKTRWGYSNNLAYQACVSAGGDTDAGIGIGLEGQGDQCACGAGNTRWFTSTSDQKGCEGCKNAWIWVKRR